MPPDSEDNLGRVAAAHDDFGLTPRARTRRVDPLLGTDLGGITITRLLGEGGMGRVYEARQANPPRTVAVKVMRKGFASDNSTRRFEREAEFLARLQHPGIAQVYTVGSYSSDEGDVPFFVMEYVANAQPINTFAAGANLTLADRLRLFAAVCEAVSHGHDRGIIHRDLKPGNILIDVTGMPRVIDFGVARSTDSELAMTSMRTATGSLIGTAQYMSPEQFGANPHELDPRADVYALGVVLYELLSGSLPYDLANKGLHELARLVCEQPPTPLRSHDKRIPRAVVAIVEKCLEKNRRARYQSAGELADDIRRYLDGRRTRAGRDHLFGTRWLRRYLPTSMPGQVLLVVVAGIVVAGLAAVGTSKAPKGGSQAPGTAMTKEIVVTEAWHSLGWAIEKDRCYRLTVVGTCRDTAGASFGPEGTCPAMLYAVVGPQTGLPEETRALGYVDQHPIRALIARIDDKSWSIRVGSGLTFLAPDSGVLSIRINEPEGSELNPEGTLTCTLEPVSQPRFVTDDRTTTIWAHVDHLDTLLISPRGLQWEYGGRWARVGQHEGVFPTLVNGIAWWPMWTDPLTSSVLETADFKSVAQALAEGKPGVRVLDVTARHGRVTLQPPAGNVARLQFEDLVLGSGDIGCTIELAGTDTPPVPRPDL